MSEDSLMNTTKITTTLLRAGITTVGGKSVTRYHVERFAASKEKPFGNGLKQYRLNTRLYWRSAVLLFIEKNRPEPQPALREIEKHILPVYTLPDNTVSLQPVDAYPLWMKDLDGIIPKIVEAVREKRLSNLDAWFVCYFTASSGERGRIVEYSMLMRRAGLRGSHDLSQAIEFANDHGLSVSIKRGEKTRISVAAYYGGNLKRALPFPELLGNIDEYLEFWVNRIEPINDQVALHISPEGWNTIRSSAVRSLTRFDEYTEQYGKPQDTTISGDLKEALRAVVGHLKEFKTGT